MSNLEVEELPHAGVSRRGPTTTNKPAPGVGRDRTPRRNRGLRDRPLWVLIPAGLAVMVIVLIPLVLTIWLSFLNINPATLREWLGAPFIGIANYIRVFTVPSISGVTLLQSIGVSVGFTVLTVAIATPIGVLAALSVHRRFRGSGVVRALYLVPYVIPTFVVGLVARLVFLPSNGLLDDVRRLFGANAPTHLLTGGNAFWSLTIVGIWTAWPFIYLLTLAGLQAIPRELHEAASLDGATLTQRLRYIVFPGIGKVLTLGVLLSTINHFGTFTLPFVMFQAPPPASAQVLPISVYFNAFSSFNYGAASAMAVVIVIILLIPAFIYIRATKLTDPS